MKRSVLKREGEKWVSEQIITDEQFEQLLAKYPKRDPNFIIVLFAIILSGLGFLTFIFSDWAQQAHFSRLLIIMIAIAVLYALGNYFYTYRSELLGISFITLGYIVFGTGMFLGIHIYDVFLMSAWPFVLWSIIGLVLYAIYDHKLLFAVGIIMTTIGQIYSGITFSSFNWIIFLVLIFGFAHYTYHRSHILFGYLFSLSFVLQMLVFSATEHSSYYWLIVYFLVLYMVSDIVPKPTLKKPFKYISLLAIFILGIYQTLLLQEIFFIDDLSFETSFIIVWALLMLVAVFLKVKREDKITLIDFVLYLPLVYLSSSSVLILVSLFVFSLAWLFIGYRLEDNERIIMGTIAFLVSTFTAYIQFAWDAMNKSLFFLIGGLLLFTLSYILEKQRQNIMSQNGGGHQ